MYTLKQISFCAILCSVFLTAVSGRTYANVYHLDGTSSINDQINARLEEKDREENPERSRALVNRLQVLQALEELFNDPFSDFMSKNAVPRIGKNGTEKEFLNSKEIMDTLTIQTIFDLVEGYMDKFLKTNVARKGMSKRMSDAGFGSRIHAGSSLAKSLMSLRSIYGDYGPGKKKRSTVTKAPNNGLVYTAVKTVNGKVKKNDEILDEESLKNPQTKRESTRLSDFGFGSGVVADSKIARSSLVGNTIYGSSGHARMKRSAMMPVDPLDIDSQVPGGVMRTSMLKRFLTDTGFGSRISAGNKVARSMIVGQDVYGSSGPGRR